MAFRRGDNFPAEGGAGGNTDVDRQVFEFEKWKWESELKDRRAAREAELEERRATRGKPRRG